MTGRIRRSFLKLAVVILPVALLAPPGAAQVKKVGVGAPLLPKAPLAAPVSVLGAAMRRRSADLPEAPPEDVISGTSYRNDTSPPLRDMEPVPYGFVGDREANENRKVPLVHKDSPDEVVQNLHVPAPNMPGTTPNFDGIVFPGVGCNCAPPDTNGEVGPDPVRPDRQQGRPGLRQGHWRLGLWPRRHHHALVAASAASARRSGDGDPVVIYDQLANRWLISQFAGSSMPTDECVAVSTSSDATGSYYRYDFHLGTNFFDYPHLAVWPDGYYMSRTSSIRRGRLPRPTAVRLRPRADAAGARRPSSPGEPRIDRATRPARPTWTAQRCRPPAPPTRSCGYPWATASTRSTTSTSIWSPRPFDVDALRQPGRALGSRRCARRPGMRPAARHDQRAGRHRPTG